MREIIEESDTGDEIEGRFVRMKSYNVEVIGGVNVRQPYMIKPISAIASLSFEVKYY